MTTLLKLSEYFQPLNLQTLSLFAFLFFSFDSWGTLIKTSIYHQKHDSSRLINWLIGLGAFSFIWFLLRFFISPQPTNVLISFLILDVVSFPFYFKAKAYLTLLHSLWAVKFPLLVIALFLPAVFVKASLPPYYSDETAYHFISPADLKYNIKTWQFNGGLYSNLPQLFDLHFILSFALTKTYSVVRLTHFLILITAMSFAYSKIRERFILPAAALFIFAFFSLPQDLILSSTLGYVDVATYSFMLIGLITTIEFVLFNSPSSLFVTAIFWGMALGTKYTSLTSLISLFPIILFFIIRKSKRFSFLLVPKNVLFSLFLIIAFGGYWYLKNLVVYGNPVYPFIFPCAKYASQWCGATTDFFGAYGGWTTKINLANLKTIMDSLFPRNPFLIKIILLTPIFILFNKNSKTRNISFFLASIIFLEFLILKHVSGFYVRYHQHLQLWFLLLVSVQLANKYSHKLYFFLATTVHLSLIITLITSFIYTVRLTNSYRFINKNELNYALGRIDIYDWTKIKFPRVYQSLSWCENPQTKTPASLARFDPDLIWFEDDGSIRSFFTNCFYENPPLDGIPLNQVLDLTISQKMQFWLVSINPCLPSDQVKPKRPLGDDADEHMIYLRRLNNLIVCNSQQIHPNLYHFDYQKL